MRNVYLGAPITLTGTFLVAGAPVDPPDVALSIYHNNVLVTGPHLAATTAVVRLGAGTYSYTWTPPQNVPLGVMEARFTGTIGGDLVTLTEQFDVSQPVDVDITPLLQAPHLHGTMRESPLYQVMGVGFTDRIFLIGHADGLELNDPYRVVSVQDAVNKLGADDVSPLLRALLESYYSGARDLYLVAAAPMSEYVPELVDRNTPQSAWGGATFYQRYHARLQETYQLLLQWDLPHIIVPVEASFMDADGADFLTQLAQHCAAAFLTTGVIRIGLLGCRGQLTDDAIERLLADDRQDTQGSAGKFVAILAGEGLMNLQEMPTAHSTSVAAVAAGELCTLKMDRGLCYHRLKNVVSPTHFDLREDQIQALAKAKINPLIRMPAGRRGASFNCAMATDNTVGATGSDYWSLVQVRLISKVSDTLRAYGRNVIGNSDFADFRSRTDAYLARLVAERVIRDFDAWIRQDEQERHRVMADIVLKPFFGIREIAFSVEVGPQNVGV